MICEDWAETKEERKAILDAASYVGAKYGVGFLADLDIDMENKKGIVSVNNREVKDEKLYCTLMELRNMFYDECEYGCSVEGTNLEEIMGRVDVLGVFPFGYSYSNHEEKSRFIAPVLPSLMVKRLKACVPNQNPTLKMLKVNALCDVMEDYGAKLFSVSSEDGVKFKYVVSGLINTAFDSGVFTLSGDKVEFPAYIRAIQPILEQLPYPIGCVSVFNMPDGSTGKSSNVVESYVCAKKGKSEVDVVLF